MRTRDKCPLCEAPAARAEHCVRTRNGYELHECPSCTLVYDKEILEEDELLTIYDEAYARRYEEEALARQNRSYADRFFSRKPRGRVLEVGCGTGHFLRRLGEFGFETYGVEVNPACAAYASDLRVVVAPFEEMPQVWPEGWFDYVVTFHLLEHLAEPVAAVQKAAAFLKPDGVWFNYMPHVRARGRRLQSPAWIHFNPAHRGEHVNFFDEPTLRLLAEKAGLEVYRVEAGGDDFWSEARLRRAPNQPK
ncbi:MAG: class I SAM-dependent methyltransferase [Candidatus Coatesbacteria bacterium]|nr:MAG: class I SAM-dependent methyltransferase [Candidatus Coatesbacteria bacterium]